MSNDWLIDGEGDTAVVLAHGAGAGMDTPFMDHFARGLAATGVSAVRFEFPYMQRRRESGGRRPPDRMPALLDHYFQVVAALRGRYDRLLIGGKSMGGRIASMIADGVRVEGVVCLGYPFHPPRKPERLRTEHLKNLRRPALIVQGSRDPFGSRDQVDAYHLSSSITLRWLDDGDHGFKPRVRSGHTLQGHLDQALAWVAEFVCNELPGPSKAPAGATG